MLNQFTNLPSAADGILLATPSLSIPWAIVILAILIGLAITLSPSGRTSEIKRQRED